VQRVTWEDVARARERIAPHANRTPVLTSSGIDRACGARVQFKCENLQKTGSFKFRGALNAVAALSPEERARGVCAHSSGNHAQALALAASIHGIPAYLVMPEDASIIKRQATAAYGGQISLCLPTHKGRAEAARRIAADTGATPIGAHNDPQVIAGQGTALAEMIDDVGDLDLVLVPVGGGGLLAGTLIAAARWAPRARVIGCEPAGADDAYRSLQEGRRITEFTPRTIADGLRTPLGENPFAILRDLVDRIVLVSESEIVDALRLVWERMKILIEPSSAVAVAPLLGGQLDVVGRRVGVILSGGNVDLSGCLSGLDTRARRADAERRGTG